MRMLRRAPQGAPPKAPQRASQTPARPARPSRPAKSTGAPRSPLAIGSRLTEGLGQFLYDTRAELKKVVWPTWEQAVNLTALVIAVSVAVAAFVGGIDALLQRFFQMLLGGA